MNVKCVDSEKKTEHTLTIVVEFDEPVTTEIAIRRIMNRLGDSQDVMPEEPKAENKKRAPKIDWDKACALKKAGWSNKDIANELHVMESTINGAIYMHLAEYDTGKRENRCEEVSQDKD